MIIINDHKYQLSEGANGCSGCALSDMCDEHALSIHDFTYMLCENDEEPLSEFDNPIYKQIE